MLIQKGVDLDSKGKGGDTPLHAASRGAPARIVEMLLEGPGRLFRDVHETTSHSRIISVLVLQIVWVAQIQI